MEQPSIKDRRQVRLEIKLNVRINNATMGYALDISEGGMYIYTSIPFPKGNIVNLRFTLAEDGEPINTRAEVQYVQEGVGIGVAFYNMDKLDYERLRRFIERQKLKQKPDDLTSGSVKRKKILLVGDSQASRGMYKNKLILAGFAVNEAENGVDAIKSIGGDIPDLIILDLMMEGMDGSKFLYILRSEEAWKDIKVIILYGRMNPHEIEKIGAYGTSGFLSKMTTTPNKLADIVKDTLLGG